MTAHPCEECGSKVKNKNMAGHYRDLCCDCLIDNAYGADESSRPIPGCECERCEAARN